jgi:tetratricopeptide (TPR) repeat protein
LRERPQRAVVLAGAKQKGHSRLNLGGSRTGAAAALLERLPVTFSSLVRGLAGTALAGLFFLAPIEISAQPGNPSQDFSGFTAAGSYLAARHAGLERDAIAAAGFYRDALRRDPKNGELLDRAFLSLLVGGDIDGTVKLADRVVKADKTDRVARLVLGVSAIKRKRFQSARRDLAQSVRGPITDLTATLLTAWGQFGAGDSKAAVAGIDKLQGPDWYAIFKDLHAGMILDVAGQEKDAGTRLERAYKLDSSALRVVEAWGSWVSRNRSPAEALTVFETFDKQVPRHPLVVAAMEKLKKGEKLPLLVDNASFGAAEALYGLGASLGRRGGEDLGLVYLQLALYLEPNHPLALLSLADLYESLKKPELAIKAYERIASSSPLHRNAAIQMATDLDALDRGEEAEKHLQALVKEFPDDLEAIVALGNVQRGHKKFAECADTYSKGIKTLGTPEKANWVLFYFRGICFERSHNWAGAETDLKKALELYPDQPQVLNYLGYSWIDQGVHLDDGMSMIKKAVQQRPDDGYIVDSLGWAYFRLGDYDSSVKQLERAIELKPEDSTINDHLGDAYWRVGRTLEAQFQWAHARDLKPDPDDLPKILEKLKNGLPGETSSQANKAPPKKEGNGG